MKEEIVSSKIVSASAFGAGGLIEREQFSEQTEKVAGFSDNLYLPMNQRIFFYWYDTRNRSLTDTLYFYHCDHLGTPIAMTDTGGALVWRVEHTPFGGIYALPVSTVGNNLRFPGQYFDSETSLAQNWFRDYEARIGRYFEPDPENFFYPYVENQPINADDPMGLKRKHARNRPKSFCEQLPPFPDAWAKDINDAISSFCSPGQTDYPTVRCMVFAESSDNPKAANGQAMGLMQIKWSFWEKECKENILGFDRNDAGSQLKCGVYLLCRKFGGNPSRYGTKTGPGSNYAKCKKCFECKTGASTNSASNPVPRIGACP